MSGPGIEIKAWLPSDSFLWDWHVHLPWIILAGGFIRWIPLWISLGENYHWFNVLTGLIIDIVISARKECRPHQYWTSKCLTCPTGDIRLFNQHDVFLVQLQGPRWWKFLILDILHDHRTACPMDCSKVDKLTGMLISSIMLLSPCHVYLIDKSYSYCLSFFFPQDQDKLISNIKTIQDYLCSFESQV